MSLDDKIAWKARCEAILARYGFKPWWEFPERHQRVDKRKNPPEGWYRCVYHRAPCAVRIVIPCWRQSAEPGHPLPQWGIVKHGELFERGYEPRDLADALSGYFKPLGDSGLSLKSQK